VIGSALKQSVDLCRFGISQFFIRHNLKHAVLVVQSLERETELGRGSKPTLKTREFALLRRVGYPTRRKQAIQPIHLQPLSANLLSCHKNVTRRFPSPTHKVTLVSTLPPSEEEIEVALRTLTLVTGQERSALLRNMVLRELQFALPPMNNFPQNKPERSYLSPV
jgi:hypothetical protein